MHLSTRYNSFKIGHSSSLFPPRKLDNRSSKKVTYLILFNINFLLFGNGGPNSEAKLDLFLQEKADEWTHIFINQHRKSYAQVLRSPRIFHDHSNHNARTEHSSPIIPPSNLSLNINLGPEPSREINAKEGNQLIQTRVNGPFAHHVPFMCTAFFRAI